jgi:hypothetical protein
MNRTILTTVGLVFTLFSIEGAVITVNSLTHPPAAGQASLAQALLELQDGDEIRFNLPGAGPHYLEAPPEGFPPVTAHNVVINGYSQPGAVPNSNPILAPNNAELKIFLDGRQSHGTSLVEHGFGASQRALLAVAGATNVTIQGIGFLGRIGAETFNDPALFCIAFAGGASDGHVSGCWLGVDADRTTVHGANAGVAGLHFRDDQFDEHLINDLTVGVKGGASSAVEQFNVFAGMTLPILVEGAGLRISGNFLNVLPSGTNDVNNALAGLPSEGAIQVGRHGGGALIGTDGDGINDENERNIFGGVLPRWLDPNGSFHLITFYGGGPRTNIVLAGNYIGIGIDGHTRFTNGVPVISGLTADARIGSNLDGRSDAVEGNLIYNHYPAELFPPENITTEFIANLGLNAVVSLRGNTLVNNFTPPASPVRDEGGFILQYYSKAIFDFSQGFAPDLSASDAGRLRGTVPPADEFAYPYIMIDLYHPDPEGIATGQAAGYPQLPHGFLQGKTFLGSFLIGSPEDRHPEPYSFNFDISALGLEEGAEVTATANYSTAPPGVSQAQVLTSLFSQVMALGPSVPDGEPPRMSIALEGNQVVLSWDRSGFVLQSAPAVTGGWTTLSTQGTSHTVQAEEAARFYRLIQAN